MRHPRTIHRVWLGDATPLARDVAFGAQWLDLHPGWDLIEWDDERVESLRPLILDRLYEHAPTVVHRADIVRVEVVYRFGGMYVDYDMEPLRNVEPLIGESEGWTTPDADQFPGNAFFGAVAGHQGLRRLLDLIGKRGTGLGPALTTGPWTWNDAFGNGGIDILGTSTTAYPVHWDDKKTLANREATLVAAKDSYAIHHFNGPWTQAVGA